MGWHEFLMKHGIGSPGYIAKTMARQYRAARTAYPGESCRSALRRVLANRVVAQSSFGGPNKYRAMRGNSQLIDSVIDENPSLYSIIRFAVFVEHPELQNPFAPPDRFEVLDRVLSEILEREVPGWRELSVTGTREAVSSPKGSVGEAKLHDAEPHRMAPVRPKSGDSVKAALQRFLEACREPGTLFITDEWIRPRFKQLEALLTDPISSEEATSLCDAIEKRAKLDHVIEWLAESKLPWGEFNSLKQSFEKRAKALDSALEEIEYERQRSEAEAAWRTKAKSPWEAAMRDTVLQAEHDPEPVKRDFGHMARPCPRCGTTDLRWFYYIEPPHPYETREMPCFGGWVTACERCNSVVDYLGTEFALRGDADGLRITY